MDKPELINADEAPLNRLLKVENPHTDSSDPSLLAALMDTVSPAVKLCEVDNERPTWQFPVVEQQTALRLDLTLRPSLRATAFTTDKVPRSTESLLTETRLPILIDRTIEQPLPQNVSCETDVEPLTNALLVADTVDPI